jgi:predicted esterase
MLARWLSISVVLLSCKRGPSTTDNAAPTTEKASMPRSAQAESGLRSARCLGPTNATSFAIYLHGMDGQTPSDQEIGNREVLASIAERLSMRIALPRSTRACPTQKGSICWGWSFDDTELDEATSTLRAAAATCFGDKPVVLVGFSNGGYLLTRLVSTCTLGRRMPRATRVVTVGSGNLSAPLGPQPTSLADCGELTMLVGERDQYNFDPKGNLLKELHAKNANAREVRFDGGHLLVTEPLERVLSTR